MRGCAFVLAASAVTVSLGARADVLEGDEEEETHVKTALIEAGVVFGISAIGYWRIPDSDNPDLDLAWDWPSWHDKISGDAIRLDTNTFAYNAFRHSVYGLATYHAGRTNGLGLAGSTALTVGSIVAWEFLLEYREYPSLNDLIMTTAAGLEIGEPLWQVGQLWRGGERGPADRVRTTLFSPLDTAHESVLVRRQPMRRRPAWSSIVLDAGVAYHLIEGDANGEVVMRGDLDVVRDPRYVTPGPHAGAIRAGTWSRIRGQLRIGDTEEGTEVSSTRLQTRTALLGYYVQDDAGMGRFVGAGTGFTYRRDELPFDPDRVAIAHLFGPQFQLSRRTPSWAIRFDTSGYGDFAYVDAHAFPASSDPFAGPPPNINKLQSHGYYDAIGASASARLRMDTYAWSFDAEIEGHSLWQLDGPDRVQRNDFRATTPADPHDAFDLRAYWRAQIGYRFDRYGVAVAADGSIRHGSWNDESRTTYDHVLEALGQLAW
jgi:hypothetical protein